MNVKWSMARPPLVPEAWHTWSSAQVPGNVPAASGDAATERRLEWPLGTLAALRQGFERGLPRRIGWLERDASHGWTACPLEESALARAAQVFRRGVAYASPGATFVRTEHSGAYAITLVDPRGSPLDDPAATWTIVDGDVKRLWPERLASVASLSLSLTEHTKSLESVGVILAAWRASGRPRRWQIVGGGLLADVAGFAAALVGASMVLVPTTLLAMVDACVGGKTGVNFAPYGKNQVGAWYFPTAVRVWTPWLSTLPERELRAGAMECLKHAFLAGDLRLAQELKDAVREGSSAGLNQLLEPLMGFKAAIVERDPAEEGERVILNLGHTCGHALEALSQAKTQGDVTLLHGEAIGYGLIYALLLSARLGGLDPSLCEHMIALLESTGIPLTRADLAQRLGVQDLAAPDVFSSLQTYMGLDKKKEGGEDVPFVLLADLGRVAREEGRWVKKVSAQTLREIWAHFLQRLAA